MCLLWVSRFLTGMMLIHGLMNTTLSFGADKNKKSESANIQTKEQYLKVINNEATVYVIKRGDFLSKIAKNLYKNAFRWVEIYHLNKYVTNPNLIFPNRSLIVPLKGINAHLIAEQKIYIQSSEKTVNLASSQGNSALLSENTELKNQNNTLKREIEEKNSQLDRQKGEIAKLNSQPQSTLGDPQKIKELENKLTENDILMKTLESENERLKTENSSLNKKYLELQAIYNRDLKSTKYLRMAVVALTLLCLVLMGIIFLLIRKKTIGGGGIMIEEETRKEVTKVANIDEYRSAEVTPLFKKEEVPFNVKSTTEENIQINSPITPPSTQFTEEKISLSQPETLKEVEVTKTEDKITSAVNSSMNTQEVIQIMKEMVQKTNDILTAQKTEVESSMNSLYGKLKTESEDLRKTIDLNSKNNFDAIQSLKKYNDEKYSNLEEAVNKFANTTHDNLSGNLNQWETQIAELKNKLEKTENIQTQVQTRLNEFENLIDLKVTPLEEKIGQLKGLDKPQVEEIAWMKAAQYFDENVKPGFEILKSNNNDLKMTLNSTLENFASQVSSSSEKGVIDPQVFQMKDKMRSLDEGVTTLSMKMENFETSLLKLQDSFARHNHEKGNDLIINQMMKSTQIEEKVEEKIPTVTETKETKEVKISAVDSIDELLGPMGPPIISSKELSDNPNGGLEGTDNITPFYNDVSKVVEEKVENTEVKKKKAA